ncbi:MULTISPECIES: hypothetical protein [unclassified Bradyrhizobium]|uniref:hypothetical protein n=1 Tax=unclassified Bradyrhizobium TaxID=2631580 RepID=UPI0028EBBD74|nr:MULTISPECIES: hypothetical protein [unclassified Bradyrhizobium]
MNPENALIYRRVRPIDKTRVVVEEKWDLTHPDCPFIRNPWSDFIGPLGNRGYRNVVMSNQEFEAADIPLKSPK